MEDLKDRYAKKAAKPRRVEKYHNAEWDEDFYIRALTSGELGDLQAMLFEKKEKGQMTWAAAREEWVIRVVCDPEGYRLYADDEAALIRTWPASIADPIFEIGQRLAAQRKEDIDFFVKSSANGTPQPALSTT